MDENDVINVVLPEDVTTLSDGDLETLRANAKAAFNELNGQGELSAEDEATLETLVEVKLALDAEKARRAQLATDKATKRAAAVAAFADEAPEDDAEEEEDTDAEADAPAAPKTFAPISVARLKSHQAPVDLTPADVKPFRAGSGATGFALNSEMTLDDVADAVSKSFDPSGLKPTMRQASVGGQRFTQASQIAEFQVDFAPELIVPDHAEFDSTHPAYKFATDQSRLKGGSLTAAGGWCAPSETIYDMCVLESRDGLVSLPEVRVNRGGIRFTQGLDWSSIFLTNGFCFTEAEDIAGTYSVNEIQTLSVPNTVTTFTITANGGTTSTLAFGATAAQVQAALDAVSAVGTGNTSVSSAGTNPQIYTVTYVNGLGNQNLAQATGAVTGGTGTITAATTQQGGGAAGSKPCSTVPCASFTDVRLNVCGICVQSGILLNQAYPEAVRRYVSGALTAHVHRLNTNLIANVVSQSTAVTITNVAKAPGAAGQLLGALELQVEDIRYKYRMGRGTIMEVILPYWVRGALRQDFAARVVATDPYAVADAEIARWFAMRGINPQFVYDWQNLGGGNAAIAWPTSVQFVIYPAGTFVRGTSSLVTLSNLYDSTLYSNNNFTALFTEEGWSVMKMCPESRVVTVPLCYSGSAAAGQTVTCP